MPGPSLFRWGAGVAAVLVVLTSPHLGRAEPTGAYRPDLPPDALESGCYPLPAGVVIDQEVLPHQVRTDGDTGGRRVLVGQWDLVDEPTARERLVGAFEAGGFREERGLGDASEAELTGPDGERVGIELTPLDGVPDDSSVRGTFVLDLPSAPLAPGRQDDEECTSPFSTKRFP